MNLQKVATFSILTSLMTIVFYTNYFGMGNTDFGHKFQRDSESLVLGKILLDKYKIATSTAGLGFFTDKNYEYTTDKILQSYTLIYPKSFFVTDNNWVNGFSRSWSGFYDTNSKENKDLYQTGRLVKLSPDDSRQITRLEDRGEYLHVHLSGNIPDLNTIKYPIDFIILKDKSTIVDKFIFTPYSSQYGLHGHAFSYLYNQMGINKLNVLRILSTFLLSATLSLLCILLASQYNLILAIIFYLVFITSPWITAFSGNLYWIPFTWFLPSVVSILLLRNVRLAWLYLPLIYITILIKSLCGYEYLSTILIFTVSFWVIELVSDTKENKKQTFTLLAVISILCIFGFASAILIHASTRHNDTITGLKQIWTQDVMRRTYSVDTTNFNPVYKDSLLASPYQVVEKYFSWNTPITYGIDGQIFPITFFTALFYLIYNFLKQKKNYKIDLSLFLIMTSAPLSWFVLAKAHSYIHTHINFVLWYFGSIQIIFYLIVKLVLKKIPYLIDISKKKIDEL